MTTLTDRYIWAVTRSVPEQQRSDIERELRASIDDDIEARGGDIATAERETLLALGDPDRLAASYAQRPAMLIGPKYFFDYVRLLRVLYAIVLPITVVAVAAAHVIARDGIGEIIGGSIVAGITIGAHLGFWTTLVFAVIERTDAARTAPLTEWKPESLPQIPDRRAGTGLAELIPAVVFLPFFAGAIVWQQLSSVFQDAAGAPVPLLRPELWSFWIPYTFVLIALELVFAVVLYRLQRWTWPMAIVNVLLNLAFMIPATWLVLQDRVFNPVFTAELGFPDGLGAAVLAPVMVLVFLGAGIGDAADGIVKARRASLASR